MRAPLVLLVTLVLGATPAAAITVFNNGSAPPNPANVIDHDIFSDEHVYVNDFRCFASFPCANPGAPTTLAIVAGGVVMNAEARNRSTLIIAGGAVLDDVFMDEMGHVLISAGLIGDDLFARDVVMEGGEVAGEVSVSQLGRMRWSGGQIGGRITLFVDSLLEVVGTGFAINGLPVPYGDTNGLALPPPNPDLTRTLTGVLSSGEAFEVDFIDSGPSAVLFLVSVPEPSAACLALAALVALRRRSRPR